MGTKVNSNYEDLISFVRASGGGRATALRPVSYGSELVENGDFELGDNGDWVVQSYWSIADGKATKSPGSSRLKQELNVSAGTIYQITLTVTHRAGNLTVSLGGDALPVIDSSGTFNLIAVCGSSTSLLDLQGGGTTDCDVDNISVKEVLFDQPDGTLTLFEHPENVPRVEYDADGNRLGLLIEEQRTNLALNSNYLAADWSEQATTATLTQDVVGPDGKISAWTLVDDNSGGTASTVGIQENLTFASGGTYAISIFAKADGLNWIYFSNVLFDGGTDRNYFDLENVALGASNPNTCFIEDVGNGWRRCTQVMTTTTDLSGIIVIKVANSDGDITVDLDGTSSVQLYGFQIEAGSFPTSYIKNEGTPSGATRSADVVSIPVADFGYNQSAGTVVVEASTNSTAVTNHSDLNIKDASGFKVITSGSRVGGSAEGTYSAYSPTTSVLVNKSSVITEGNTYKAAYALADNDVALSVNGTSVVTDTSTSITSLTATTVEIGDGFEYLHGHIKSIKYFPRRLTNAQLVDLTS